jgi:hypothetical protein
MKRNLSLLAIISSLLMTDYVIADEEQSPPVEQKPLTYSEKAKQIMHQLKPVSVYTGVGLFSDMLNINNEAVTDLGNFYLRVGKFMESDAGAAFNMGWRYPITGGRDESGYFVGAFVGQVVASVRDNNQEYHRNGAGLDISYHWVNEHTRKTMSVGLGTGFSRRVDGNANEPAQPRAFFSFSTALKVF